ncbi:MAG TPA: hypothetical protein VKZ53_15985 [Candidatus Angelobacter sp.]|nr:hypothetical protein [Candidatus Angelobacter sp.]
MIKMRKKKLELAAMLVLACCFAVRPRVALAQSGTGQAALNDASAKGSLAVYQNFSKYPPESRPLDSTNWDLLHPWSTDASWSPLMPQAVVRQMDSLRATGATDEEVLRSVTLPSPLPRYRFDLNKSTLTGTHDEFRAKLSMAVSQDSETPLSFHISKAELIGDDDFGSPKLGAVPFSCEASGASCTFRWKAPSEQKQFWGMLSLVVTGTAPGIPGEFVVRQPFFSSPMTAGKFTGQFQERIENGSLVIDAGVEVKRRMACFVSANLFSADHVSADHVSGDRGIPTHHAERRLIVDPSMKTISFSFFGKIFRDGGHEGAFRLQDLKGQCENLSYPPEWFIDSVAHKAELQALQNKPAAVREPSKIYFEYAEHTYTTQRYAGAVFSDQEWQSPERTRKLEMLKRAAAEMDNPTMTQKMDQKKKQLQQPIQ